MNNELHVWIYPPQALTPNRCGTLELVGGRRCLFSYSPSWLTDKAGFALSPDLPLQAGRFEPANGQELHPIFEDAGPDRWGRRVIDTAFRPARRSPIDYLALAGEDRIGALGFSWDAGEYRTPQDQAFYGADLGALASAAHAIEVHEPIDERLRRLLQPGRSVGGARPKAIIQEDGRFWIAKFAAEGDEVDVSAIEHASLLLARECGIEAPASRLVPIRGRNVLLVERFDREATGARRHFASAKTLIMAQGISPEDIAYSDLADVARRFSPEPKADSLQVFRRMIFNVLMENTDDHEKNHAFLFERGKWKLSPAYDIQPQIQNVGYQQLRVGVFGHEPSIANAMSECGRFMLTKEEASAEVERAVAILGNWPERFAEAGVAERDVATCMQFVRVRREQEAAFGQIPEKLSAINTASGMYIGKIVAIRPDAIYQAVGRGDVVAHPRSEVSMPVEVGAKLRVQYQGGKLSDVGIEGRAAAKRRSPER
ncbi:MULTISPECIES: type II toxin-antitoxin system HipA family toxin [unclassified Caballeronia]|uniref:type II toxin-antitoxin system HipA family toxin n=1 Tax=unclassified Caballeronia TaxID=2646786 RepID=UPI0028648A81|nr:MULTISPECIES: type II toxin-antitoxin system HipA family toxin [unclassified Caballeronia]MDR5776980.1 type II toxin-antitoxin system HipA family toxin [Caballeronia sp. LZ002]MDR5852445.1 type II toxin-antitoxin system HipA family toxin [Caballeronia sp. LZ003]